MGAYRIVKSLNVSENVGHSLSPRSEVTQVDALAFETTEKVFGNSVVIGIPLTRHALEELKVKQALTVIKRGVLDATVRVKD
jgi:hypothetical protein